ncbi:MAG: NYN domain-containing protein [Planctomycetes bacterium]|nr:NYN domain-containing protein [Planctomycetota bacterium]
MAKTSNNSGNPSELSEYNLDAYNIIFKIASLGHIDISSNDKFTQLRDISVMQMKNYFIQRRTNASFFFDGRGPGWYLNGNQHHCQYVSIIYSGEKTADALMIEHIRTHPNARKITVVTEDNEILSVARAHKCRIISSTDFITRITSIANKAEKEQSGRFPYVKSSSKRSKASERKKKIISHMHFADIEEQFSKIDMNDILKELAEEDGIDYGDNP